MKPAPLPPDEEERLLALEEYKILDTGAESIFDNITEIASKICGVPISLISLIDRDRQWFKSTHGYNATQTSRDTAFCSYAILDSNIMEVSDATKDERFFDNPLVLSEPHVRFYAGVPLINPRGFKLGTLCVIDNQPKTLTPAQKDMLETLSKIVISFFEIKKAIISDIHQRKLASEALASANETLKRKLVEQEQSKKELLLLGEMSSVLQACMTALEAYSAITKFCSKLFPHSTGVLFLLHPTHNHIERIASWGSPSQNDFFSYDGCWALRRNQPHYVTNAKTDLICQHMDVYKDVPNYICLPLMAQGESLGLLTLEFDQKAIEQPFTDTQRLLALAVAEQISLALANAKLRESLHQQSIRDPLTGLYNRRYLTDTLTKKLPHLQKTNTSLAFLLIDIDYFKTFNDTYGHEAGDLVLKHVSRLLQNFAKDKGDVCRFGGEEFIMTFENVNKIQAEEYAEQLRKKIQTLHIQYHNITLPHITFSIGIAVYPEHGRNLDILLTASDTALYKAKENGRNQVIVSN